jgi:hypothetical protein
VKIAAIFRAARRQPPPDIGSANYDNEKRKDTGEAREQRDSTHGVIQKGKPTNG